MIFVLTLIDLSAIIIKKSRTVIIVYAQLNKLLSDQKGGEIFTCYCFAHWCYIAFIVITIALFLYLTRNKDRDYRRKKISIFANIGFGLYMADFFLMPFAYGYIDVDKLPFHACTSMAIMCFLGEHAGFFKKYRIHFALLAFLSNFAYICYPSGVMSYEIHPLSYRAVQTLLFHSVITVYAFLTFVNDAEEFKYKTWYRNLVVLGSLTVWALIGNTLYSGEAGGTRQTLEYAMRQKVPFVDIRY